jgi:preprotein translocase subunit SecG
MFEFLIILALITAVLLVLVVLAQNSKGGGLSSQFGGSGSSQLMGVKRTTDLLEKLTWGLAIALFVFSLSSSFMIPEYAQEQGVSSPNLEKARDRANLPGLDTELTNPELDTTGGVENFNEEDILDLEEQQ